MARPVSDILRNCSGLALLTLVLGAMPVSAQDQSAIDFARDVRPLLSDKCFHCHGPDPSHREADLRLDELDDVVGEDLGIIIPGAAEDSELWLRITDDDEDSLMPPPDSGLHLTDEEIEILRQWIDDGANWSVHWAYLAPEKHAVPTSSFSAMEKNWIDAFVFAAMEKQRSRGLELSPADIADPVTLVRRLSFDLTGLPPDPDFVDRFTADPSDTNYERLVDALLESPQFGERMAMYWLDLVRFADTVGYHGDQDHNISPYRDYVIDAFNRNLAFDRFTHEQLAGDLLPDSDVDALIASGYNRLLQTSHEGGVQPKEYLAMYAADRVRNVSVVWMGGTLGCAQCHDHKYDPFTMTDFYSLAAFFADLDEAQHFKVGTNALPTARPPEMKVLPRLQRRRLQEIEARLAELSQLGDEQLSSELSDERQQLTKEAEQLRLQERLTMVSAAIDPRPTRLLPRGNWLDESGPIMEPAVPSFLGQLETQGERATRLDLARWLTDAESGSGRLTARVFANRFWYIFMGRGIAADLEDFGGQGQPPTHPQLLDNLALAWIDSGWDTKSLIKLIVMSHTYRQSSNAADSEALDPDNKWFARQRRYRLPAEMIRDNALAVSGLLVDSIGGASVKPYQPAGYYQHLNFPPRKYQHDANSGQWRRGVYVHWQRQFLHPMLRAFDAPRREECTAQRPVSNTPLAALVLMNDPTFVEASRVFAERILNEEGNDDEGRLRFAFRQVLSRSPDDFEQEVLLEFLQANLAEYRADVDAATALTDVGIAPRDETLDPAEHAAWTAVARVLLNLSEAVTRN